MFDQPILGIGIRGHKMKSSEFVYHRPESIDEVVTLFEQHGDEAKVLAGGQSLVPLMALRIAAPEILIDINGVSSLDWWKVEDGRLSIGALTRHRAIEQSPQIGRACTMISEGVSHIGHVAIRNRGTVVGSLTHADPAAEWPAIVVALDGQITVVGPGGTRKIGAEDFFESYLTTSLADDEFAIEVDLQMPAEGSGSAFVELARRHGDFAVAGVAAVVGLDADGRIAQSRIVIAGAGSTPMRSLDAEASLVGKTPSPEALASAAGIVHDFVHPSGDNQGSVAYRRRIASVLTRRALEKASVRAKTEGGMR